MTAFSKTFINSVRFLGGAYSPKWQQYNWAAFNWGFGTDVQAAPIHMNGDSTALVTQEIFNVSHKYLAGEAFSLVDIIAAGTARILSGSSFSVVSTLVTENLLDGSGYFYVFPSGQQNAHLRATPVYTSSTAGFTSFTSVPPSSTAWVES